MAVSFVANSILALLQTGFLVITLKARFGKLLTCFLAFLFVAASFLFGFLFPNQDFLFLKTILSLLVILAGTFVAFKDKWPRHILTVGIIFMNEWLCEFIGVLVFPSIVNTASVTELTLQQQIIVYIIFCSVFALLSWVFALILNQKSSGLELRDLLLFAFFPLSQTALTCATLTTNADLALWSKILTIPIYFLADIGLYFAMIGLSQRSVLKVTNEQLAWQIDAQKEHYSALTAQFENIHKLRHDIAGHLHTIQALLEEGQVAEASSYAAELSERHTLHPSLGKCENPVIDAFLYDRINRGKDLGIRIELHISLPYEMRISNADIISAFSNLMDNAEEACLQVAREQRFIRLQAEYKDRFFVIRTENPLPANPKNAKKQRVAGMERGIGLHILEALAQQYKGSFLAEAGQEFFCSVLTLQEL